jgi:hypothetical protein
MTTMMSPTQITKKQQQSSKEKKENKEKKHAGGNPDGSSSDSSDTSSSSNKTDTDDSRTDKSKDSDTEYDGDGVHITNNITTTFSTNHKIRSKQSRKIANIHKKSPTAVKTHQLGTFNTTRGDMEQGKRYFRHWIRTLLATFSYTNRAFTSSCVTTPL